MQTLLAREPGRLATFSWTGCYVGGLWVNKDVTGPFGGTVSADSSRWAAGLQAGCNHQFAGGFVIGIQGDYNWADAGFIRDTTGFFFNHPSTIDFRVKSVASVTGRIGYAWDRFLGYVKGGGAWERDELTVDFFNTGMIASRSDARSGWTIGIGGEYASTNWITGFVEYDYYNFAAARGLGGGLFHAPGETLVGLAAIIVERDRPPGAVYEWPHLPRSVLPSRPVRTSAKSSVEIEPPPSRTVLAGAFHL